MSSLRDLIKPLHALSEAKSKLLVASLDLSLSICLPSAFKYFLQRPRLLMYSYTSLLFVPLNVKSYIDKSL